MLPRILVETPEQRHRMKLCETSTKLAALISGCIPSPKFARSISAANRMQSVMPNTVLGDEVLGY
jgi:hypothetical protein